MWENRDSAGVPKRAKEGPDARRAAAARRAEALPGGRKAHVLSRARGRLKLGREDREEFGPGAEERAEDLRVVRKAPAIRKARGRVVAMQKGERGGNGSAKPGLREREGHMAAVAVSSDRTSGPGLRDRERVAARADGAADHLHGRRGAARRGAGDPRLDGSNRDESSRGLAGMGLLRAGMTAAEGGGRRGNRDRSAAANLQAVRCNVARGARGEAEGGRGVDRRDADHLAGDPRGAAQRGRHGAIAENAASPGAGGRLGSLDGRSAAAGCQPQPFTMALTYVLV